MAELDDGTFTDFLNLESIAWQKGARISLEECLARIPELTVDYFTVVGQPPHSMPITVEATRQKFLLPFMEQWTQGEQDFRINWQTYYPALVDDLELEQTGCVLKAKASSLPATLDAVSALCEKVLQLNLVLMSDQPSWHITKITRTDIVWPRPSYYTAALFILGSIVRYNPEILLKVSASKWSWLLERFMIKAERFYPNLMWNWLSGHTVFFGTI